MATEFENQHPTDSETGRRLGGGDDDGGHGHAPHAPCNVDKTWTLSATGPEERMILEELAGWELTVQPFRNSWSVGHASMSRCLQ